MSALPPGVRDRIAHRERIASTLPDCTRDGCTNPGTLSASCRPGRWCDTHYPWPELRNPTPDPARTLDGCRTAAGIPLTMTAPARTVFDDKAESSGQRVSAARRAQARGDDPKGPTA